jgi:hypothetical protein
MQPSTLRHNKEWPTADLTCVQCQRSVCISCMQQNAKWAAGTSDICGEFPNCKASGRAAAAAHPAVQQLPGGGGELVV